MAISTDTQQESQKLDVLLPAGFNLLSDPDLRVIQSLQMEHAMGGETIGNMGYTIIDGSGQIRLRVVDPLFGQNTPKIIEALKALPQTRS